MWTEDNFAMYCIQIYAKLDFTRYKNINISKNIMDIFKYLLCDRGYKGLKLGPTILNQSLYLCQLQLVLISPHVSPSMWGIKADFSSLDNGR